MRSNVASQTQTFRREDPETVSIAESSCSALLSGAKRGFSLARIAYGCRLHRSDFSSWLQLRIMHSELSDCEWGVIKPNSHEPATRHSPRANCSAVLLGAERHPLTQSGRRPTHINEVHIGDAAGEVQTHVSAHTDGIEHDLVGANESVDARADARHYFR